jgi:hypothetical protein
VNSTSPRSDFRQNPAHGRSWRLNEDIGHLEKKLYNPEPKPAAEKDRLEEEGAEEKKEL